MFGIKALPWQSVEIPMIMPKPDLVELTGGYRKTPVLQIGADVFCDTALIARIIEQHFPDPPLATGTLSGLAYALAAWSDRSLFEPGAALSMGENPAVPDAVINDRKKFFNFMDFSTLAEQLPHCRTQFRAEVQLIEDSLGGGEKYLSGSSPGLIDIQAWFSVWMANANIPSAAALLAPFPQVAAWSARMREIGHGHRSELSADAAISIARDSGPSDEFSVDADDPLQLRSGDLVRVAATDYGRDPRHRHPAGP